MNKPSKEFKKLLRERTALRRRLTRELERAQTKCAVAKRIADRANEKHMQTIADLKAIAINYDIKLSDMARQIMATRGGLDIGTVLTLVRQSDNPTPKNENRDTTQH